MENLNIIASVCSIAGLLVSLFLTSKVNKLSHVEIEEDAQAVTGSKNNVARDHSVIAASNAVVNYQSISDGDGKPPVLTEMEYQIMPVEYDKYRQDVSGSTCDMKMLGISNNFRFMADFSGVESRPELNRWIGFAFKSLPMYDWRSFVQDGYVLEFGYIATDNISNVWIELTNKKLNKKIYKESLALFSEEKKFHLPLERYKNRIKDWASVDEICFVFFPEECIGQRGTVFITDLTIKRHEDDAKAS